MNTHFLEVRGLIKRYDESVVVDHVDLHVQHGEIVGLVGENGAGKSTILNILSGVAGIWSGEILLEGRRITPRNYHEATLAGITRVFQEQALVPNLKVYENICLCHENRFRKGGVFLDRTRMAALSQKYLKEFGLDIDVHRPTSDYDFSTRQAIEIARACQIPEILGRRMPLILLDEPTAALTRQEVEIFFERIAKLKNKASFIFVSHRLSEVLALSDRIYVLKDGKIAAEVTPGQVSESELHEVMVGRKRDRDYYKEDQQQEPVLGELIRVEKLSNGKDYEEVSLNVCPGEILGVGGLVGSGKAALGRSLAGLDHPASGRFLIEGRESSPATYLKWARLWAGYVPQERLLEGIILYHSIEWNMTLADLRKLKTLLPGFISLNKERQLAEGYIRRLRIKTPNSRTLAVHLSGGNQQKVVLSKWMLRQPRILILDNPTRGMDAGAKEEIYGLLRELNHQENPTAIVLISDELLELIGMSHRIVIMKDGRLVYQVDAPPKNKPTERDLVQHMV